MYVLVKNCSKGWRYDYSSCYFNVRLILSLFLSLNFISLLLTLFPKRVALLLALFGPQYPGYLKFTYPVVLFFLLTIKFPKKKLSSKYFVPEEKEQFFRRNFWLYCIFSIVVIILTSVYKG
jgi:hypothetical protein